MKKVRYPAEFKAEAVKQVTERGHGVVDAAQPETKHRRLDVAYAEELSGWDSVAKSYRC